MAEDVSKNIVDARDAAESAGLSICEKRPFHGILRTIATTLVVSTPNDTRYGLAASIWTRDIGAGHRIADRIEAGIVWVNTLFELDLMAPFGGYKLSGAGRELGAESLDAFLQTKTVVLRY